MKRLAVVYANEVWEVRHPDYFSPMYLNYEFDVADAWANGFMIGVELTEKLLEESGG